MLAWIFILALSGFSFCVGYIIVQADVLIPVIWYGRKWKMVHSWNRQISLALIFVGVSFAGLFIASNESSINKYFPIDSEWAIFVIVITSCVFAGILYARLQLRDAPDVIIAIINSMFPPTNEITLGANDVDAGSKVVDFIEKSAGTYKNAFYVIANLMNSPLLSWMLLSTFTRFINLTEEEQKDFVRKWYGHDEIIIRSLAHLFKALGSLGYYTDPRIWREIGFPGPFVPQYPRVTDHSDEVPGHIVKDNINLKFNYSDMPQDPKVFGIARFQKRSMKYQTIVSDMEVEADVCIIGSGAAGGLIAYELSKNPEIQKIVLLERGSYYEGEDFNQREIDMISKLWKGGAMTMNQNYTVFIGQGETLGGTSVINHAICIDTPKIVLDDWSKMGVSKWITEQKSFQQTLDKIKDEIHVKLVPNIEINNNNIKLKIWAENNQIQSKGHGPNPRNTLNCTECGFSHLGCHYSSKQSTLTTYIPKAVKSKKCIVYCDCHIENVQYKDNIATGVEGEFRSKDENTKFKFKLKSKLVIVSGGAINSSAILLRSKIPDPKKQIGKGLTIHPSPLVIGVFPEKIQAYKGTPMTYNISEYSVLNGIPGILHDDELVTSELEKEQKGGFMLESVFPNPGQLGAFIPGIEGEHQKLMKKLDNFAAAGVLIRDTPKGIIEINKSGEPVIKYKLDEHDKKNLANGIRKLAEIYFDLGAEKVIVTRRSTFILERKFFEEDKDYIKKQILPKDSGDDKMFLGAVHPQGGNKMGESIETSVVNSYCQHHLIKNLFVCDASVFPTALGVNPMLTIMGIAKRTAEYINLNWKEINSKDIVISDFNKQ